ncbi:MAG: enoyl-CoA hydratase-related protein [Candidatus Adiutricales bacterium]
MSEDLVKIEIKNNIGFLSLNGIRDLNLLHKDLVLELARVLKDINGDPAVRVLVMKGNGERAFSGGVDVRKMKEFSPWEAEDFIRALHTAMKLIMTLNQPVIASVFGPCLGGAMEIVMAADMVIAAEDALFGLPEIRVGVPSVIEASLLPQVIGLSRARELILTGDIITASEAFRLGLVNRVVSRDMLEEETLKKAQQFLRLSPKILSVQKDIIDKWQNLGQDQSAEYSIKAFALCFTTGHPREAMEAFLAKREPEF